MNSGNSVNVYAEAKSEYTRQLCQILTPSIQLYFIDILKSIKDKEPDSKRLLWNFQAHLQEIPDWNQDKVIRETEKIQHDSNCDYLEELLTAVFVAHTKVLSAIRMTTKQKKLQLTIPKIDHFLHRTLRETGRILWGNAFLFAEQGSPIERQKNMRQIEALIMDGIQQSIRSLLPVKAILKEYLNNADEDEDEMEEKPNEGEPVKENEEHVTAQEEIKLPEPLKTEEEPVKAQEESIEVPAVTEEVPMVINIQETIPDNTIIPDSTVLSKSVEEVLNSVSLDQEQGQGQEQTIHVETEPSVSFTNKDTIYHSDNPDDNEIAEAEVEEEVFEIDHIELLDQPPEPIDQYEDLESTGGFEYEEIKV